MISAQYSEKHQSDTPKQLTSYIDFHEPIRSCGSNHVSEGVCTPRGWGGIPLVHALTHVISSWDVIGRFRSHIMVESLWGVTLLLTSVLSVF